MKSCKILSEYCTFSSDIHLDVHKYIYIQIRLIFRPMNVKLCFKLK